MEKARELVNEYASEVIRIDNSSEYEIIAKFKGGSKIVYRSDNDLNVLNAEYYLFGVKQIID